MISFIILHYKNLNDTLECIESIKKLNNKDVSIVIVDNGTLSNNDINHLKKYTSDFVLNGENIGFAKGNNAGAKYAIEKYKPEFLCVINNDTIINQPDFIDKIINTYNNTNFDILGPKIVTNDGESVNPFPAYTTLEEVREKIKYHEKLVKIYKNVLLRSMLNIYLKINKIFKKTKHLENGIESKYDVSLHGCALIFSKKYYEKYSDIFYNETFLYHEEEFLEYRRRKDNLITYYDSNLEIFHKEGKSLDKSFNKNYDKLIFRNKEILKSLRLLENIMKEGKDI